MMMRHCVHEWREAVNLKLPLLDGTCLLRLSVYSRFWLSVCVSFTFHPQYIYVKVAMINQSFSPKSHPRERMDVESTLFKVDNITHHMLKFNQFIAEVIYQAKVPNITAISAL